MLARSKDQRSYPATDHPHTFNVESPFSSIFIWLLGGGDDPDSIRTSAIYYFLFALVMLLIAFDSYFALPLIKFFRENETKMEKEKKKGEMLSRVTTEEGEGKEGEGGGMWPLLG